MTRGDVGVVAVVCLLIAAAIITAAGAGAADTVIIRGPQGVTRVDPTVAGTYSIAGREGTIEFEARDGQVVCVDSSCRDHVCIRQGAVGPGRPIVCAPNGVVASFDRQSEGGLDAVSR